ncbi:MAG TPA: hypothetical protein VGF67_06245, partial [Ktedonobacteraceae bacterium]
MLRPCEEVLSERVWEGANVLLIGAILAKGRAYGRRHRAGDGMLGCAQEQPFPNDHRVPGRATGSSRERSHRLLLLLVRLCVAGNEPLVMGIDETIERRRGRTRAARDVSRDPVRSRQKCFVKTHGLCGMARMLVTPVPWAKRVWALPCVTVLAPSERPHEERTMRHQTITDGAWHKILHVSRWLPTRRLVIVADGTSAVLDVLWSVSRLPAVCAITRVRLDACWHDPAPEREAGKQGRPALKGKRQATRAQRLSAPGDHLAEMPRVLVWENDASEGDRHRHRFVGSLSHPSGCNPLDPHLRPPGPRRAHG